MFYDYTIKNIIGVNINKIHKLILSLSLYIIAKTKCDAESKRNANIRRFAGKDNQNEMWLENNTHFLFKD